jgi:LmbE family N-acetylglucosaminyl deacetylase
MHPSAVRRHRPITALPSVEASTYAMVGNVLTPIARPLPRRLLGVWAHPDAEAYLSAGLMRRVIAAGGEVAVLTATRGEKGTDDPARYDQDHFGAFRADELRRSLAEVGVTDVRFLGLRDGECDLADDTATISRIVDVVDEFAPDAIVTFGPDGMTNHPDHRAVSRWTTEAWRRSSTAELLYATVTHDWASLHGPVHRELGVYADCPGERPASVSRSAIALECRLSDDDLTAKRRALAAHASQTAALAELMGEETYRTWWNVERFRRPTSAELAACIVPDWVHDGSRHLIGASA